MYWFRTLFGRDGAYGGGGVLFEKNYALKIFGFLFVRNAAHEYSSNA